jgi:hypothetical protein
MSGESDLKGMMPKYIRQGLATLEKYSNELKSNSRNNGILPVYPQLFPRPFDFVGMALNILLQLQLIYSSLKTNLPLKDV